MVVQSIITPELFKSLIEIDVNGYCIDLHNDYDCVQFNFSGKKEALSISFKSIQDNSRYSLVTLQFEQVQLTKIDIDVAITAKCRTIDNLFRCRFMQDEALVEYSEDGKSFYTLEFCEGYAFDFFSAKLLLILH